MRKLESIYMGAIMDSKLNEARLTIDKIDDEMQRLFLERMHAVKLVAEYKNENNLAIFVPSRENEMKQRLFSNIQDAKLLPYYNDFLENLIENSKEYQKSILAASKDEKFTKNTDLAENIILARDALKKAGDYFDLNRKVLIITDSGIPTEYIDIFKTFCNDYLVITIVQGEENKSFENFKYICETMIKNETGLTPSVIYNSNNLIKIKENKKYKIFKLNGSITDSKSMVITELDYHKFRNNQQLLLEQLKRELILKSFLFIGYSFADRLVLDCLTD